MSGGDGRAGNPFIGAGSDQLIVSVDTLAGDRMFARLQDPSVEPYDLVIFDEAHKLSARPRARRLRSARPIGTGWPRRSPASRPTIARWALDWSAHHLLLLTATPHMGKDFPYYCLWRLLEPEVLATTMPSTPIPPDARKPPFHPPHQGGDGALRRLAGSTRAASPTR